MGRGKRLTRRCHEEADSGRPVHTCNWKHGFGCRVQEAGGGRERQRGLLLIANYLSRQLRTIIRHAVRGSGCAAFRDIARRIRTNFSLGCVRVHVHACICVCVACAALPVESAEGRGERETGVPDSVTPTVDALSPFFSPLPLPSPFVRLPRSFPSLPFPSIPYPRKACLLAVSLSLLPLPSPRSLSLLVYPEIARSHHGIIRCEVVQRPAITARSARGLYLDDAR